MTSHSEALAATLVELDSIAHRLRRECPWDREQDERSIVPHTIEEAYELAEAAHSGDDAKLIDELGDVLFQVYFLSLLLEERGQGNLEAVARSCIDKLVRRHPHVFGDQDPLAGLPTAAGTPGEVRANWDEIKRRETDGRDPLETIPDNLPALLYARKVHKRAGLDADDTEHEVEAALAELKRSRSDSEADHGGEQAYEALGRLLFAVVAMSRRLQVDPEIALRRQADRFRRANRAKD